ncbi:hypothetical protein E3N88_09957 [Mikania micrantha]|uniref:Uncharacterized protein n=1 Tax=Mikania micrantha TaxID=192012 RepID=A0A5N6PBZ2_9ASTR|nr:hypothetical protein E3N88_09957 [Mikania micrantha]
MLNNGNNFFNSNNIKKTSQMQQTQFQQTQEHVESPSKEKDTKKMKRPSKMATENDEQPTKTIRQKWPHIKSRYRSGWSNDQYIQEARQLYINDPSKKTSVAFTYEHVWNVVKEHGQYNSATHIHGFQPAKRTKTSSSRAYTSSASYANFGENPEIIISHEDIDKEDFEVQLQQVTTTRPFGRDKAKAEAKAKAKLKGKARIEPSEYDLRKLKLIDEMSSTICAKSETIEKI